MQSGARVVPPEDAQVLLQAREETRFRATTRVCREQFCDKIRDPLDVLVLAASIDWEAEQPVGVLLVNQLSSFSFLFHQDHTKARDSALVP